MDIILSKLSDPLYLKKVINDYYHSLSSNKENIILDTLISIHKTLLYLKKDPILFNKFKIEFSQISKVVYKQIYTSNSLIRLYVTKIASLLDYKDLIINIINYLKIENDLDCINEYLEFIKKYNYVGYIDEVLNILNIDKPIRINVKVIETVMYLALSYRNSYKYIDKVLSYLLKYYEDDYPKWQNFYLVSFEIFSNILKYIAQNKDKINNILLFEYLNFFIYKLANIFNTLIDKINDENTIQIVNLLILNMYFALNIINDISQNNQELRNYIYTKLEEERYFEKLNFSQTINKVYNALENNKSNNLKYFFISNFLNNKEIFEKHFQNINNNTLENIKDSEELKDFKDFISKLVSDFLKTDNIRLKNIILDFFIEFNIKLSDEDLVNFTKYLLTYEDSIILKILDIIQNSNYKLIIDILMRLLSTKNTEILEKVKTLIKK